MRRFGREEMHGSVPLTQSQFSWVQLKGEATTTIFGSENVSSITDNGAGDYTVTWQIPYATASSYAVLIGSSGSANQALCHFQSIQAIAAGSARTSFLNHSAAAGSDPDFAYLIALGEF